MAAHRSLLVLLLLLLFALPLSAATRTWSGANGDLWSDPGNWGGTVPVAGDDLVFPAAGPLITFNDLAAGIAYHSMSVTGVHSFQGKAIALTAGGLTISSQTTIDLAITLGAAQTWSIGSASLTLHGTLNLGGHDLVLSTGGTVNLYGAVNGSGNVTLTGGTVNADLGYPFSGSLTNNGAFLRFTDAGSSSYVQNAGTIEFRGTFAGATINGGTFKPGVGSVPFGTINGNLTLTSNATYVVLFWSPCDQCLAPASITVNGTVTLGGAKLVLSTSDPRASSQPIITNDGTDPISGTFAGVPEGTQVGTHAYLTYQGGTGNDLALNIIPYASATTLTASPNPSKFGQSIVLTATVTDGATGSVTFYDGFVSLATVTLAGTSAVYSTSSLSLGTHAITARYSGDAQFAASTSNVVSQLVKFNSATLTPSPLLLAKGQTGLLRIDSEFPVFSTQTLAVSASDACIQVPSSVSMPPGSQHTSFSVVAVTAPCNARVDVQLTDEFAGATLSAEVRVTEALPAPAIRGVAPASGNSGGGTRVRISGINFVPDCWADFGGALAHAVVVVSPTEMLATTPAHAEGSVAVTPRCNAGDGDALAGGFTYVSAVDPAPVVTSYDRASAAPGEDVTLNGANFRSSDTVRFGGTPATVRSTAPDAHVVTVPSVPAGTTNVELIDAGGRVATAPPFSVLVPLTPIMSSVTPRSVGAGGELVIGGSGFRPSLVFRLGGYAARTITMSRTQAILRLPLLPPGSYALELVDQRTVIGNGGDVTITSDGVVVFGVPICALSDGGATIVVRGTGFADGATVTLGGVPATSVRFIDSEHLEVVVPPLPPGPATIVVTNPGGASGTATNALRVTSRFDPDGCDAAPRPRPVRPL